MPQSSRASGPQLRFHLEHEHAATESEIEAAFAHQVGGVVSARLPGPPEGGNRGWGFVAFADPNYLRLALGLSGAIVVRGRPVIVSPAR
jgi:hypothetical protein